MTAIKRILVATNFDVPSSHALEAALGMAERFRATVTLLHVLDLPLYAYYADRLPLDFADSLERSAVAQLAELLTRIRLRIRTANGLVCHGVPWTQIAAHAEILRCDLVVLGTHSKPGAGQRLLGRVSHDVSRNCAVPVLTIPDPVTLKRRLPAYS